LQKKTVPALAVEGEMNCAGDEVYKTVSFKFAAYSNVLIVSTGVKRVLLPLTS